LESIPELLKSLKIRALLRGKVVINYKESGRKRRKETTQHKLRREAKYISRKKVKKREYM
jgi:hypothetical protein